MRPFSVFFFNYHNTHLRHQTFTTSKYLLSLPPSPLQSPRSPSALSFNIGLRRYPYIRSPHSLPFTLPTSFYTRLFSNLAPSSPNIATDIHSHLKLQYALVDFFGLQSLPIDETARSTVLPDNVNSIQLNHPDIHRQQVMATSSIIIIIIVIVIVVIVTLLLGGRVAPCVLPNTSSADG